MARIEAPAGREWADRQPSRQLAKWVADRMPGITTTQTQTWSKAMLVDIATGRRDTDEIVYGDNGRALGWRGESKARDDEPKTRDEGTAAELGRKLMELMGDSGSTAQRLDEVEKRVSDIEARNPTRITIEDKRDGGGRRDLDGVHKQVPDVIRAITDEGFDNVWLYGEMGCGKTFMCRSVADALGYQFAALSCSMTMPMSKLFGRKSAGGRYDETSFLTLYESGGLFLLDEADACPSEIFVELNAALDNGEVHLPDHHDEGRRLIKRHADFVCIVAANTFGLGPDAMYVGRSQLDGASLDRFVGAQIAVDYDREIERGYVPKGPNGQQLLEWCWKLRDKCRDKRLRRCVSTRFIRAGGRMLAAGRTMPQIRARLLASWTKPELEKVGEKL